jgi:hypothetical protein
VVVESTAREIAVVLAVAMAGLLLAGAVVFAPWHPAQAGVVGEVHQMR